jgi:hypothetical protein
MKHEFSDNQILQAELTGIEKPDCIDLVVSGEDDFLNTVTISLTASDIIAMYNELELDKQKVKSDD